MSPSGASSHARWRWEMVARSTHRSSSTQRLRPSSHSLHRAQRSECRRRGRALGGRFCAPALEIIDSRYENFRFDLKSVIADNTSASHYVTGATSLSPHAVDLKTLGVVMYKNGEVVQTGAGAAVLGDPVMSVATLANMLGARGEVIPANTLVLTGGITAAVRVDAGDHIVTRFQHLGELSVLFG